MIDPVDRVGGGGLIGEVRPGGLAEYCAVPTHNLVRLPPSVSYEAAACLPVAYGTALRMMVTIGQVKAGEKVLILGASGGVGTCCVQLAKLAGSVVIVCASSTEKLARLQDLGADYGIDYSREDFVKWVYTKYGKPHRRRFDGGVDVVVNFTGGDTWVPSLRALHRQGRLLTCGATAGFDPKEDLRYIWTFELKILGSNGWMREDLTTLLDLISSGELKPIIDRALSLLLSYRQGDTALALSELADRTGGIRAARFACLCAAACPLLTWAVLLGQETGLTTLSLVGIVWSLLNWMRTRAPGWERSRGGRSAPVPRAFRRIPAAGTRPDTTAARR